MSIYNLNGEALNSCFDIDGAACQAAYDIEGNVAFNAKQTDYASPTFTSLFTTNLYPTQGMAISNGVLFQFTGSGDTTKNNRVYLYALTSGEVIASNIPIESGHGNAAAFSNSIRVIGDEFPIIYVGDWINPIVHVNRITRQSASLLYDIVMDETQTGYHPNPAIDFANNIMYTVGYTQSDTAETTGNDMIVCKWDLSNMTDNGDGTKTPTRLDRYTISYTGIMQDLKYNDGLIWICFSQSGGNTQFICGIDPSDGTTRHTITMPITTEIEGLSWEFDEETRLYYAVIGFQYGKYYKATFSEAE